MTAAGESDRVVLLAMDLAGKDGISAVARQALGSLRELQGPGAPSIEAWSLNDGIPTAGGEDGEFAGRSAGGSQRRFVAWGLAAGARGGRGTLVVAMHLHLAPVAIPMVFRGARLAVFLHGVECWRPLTRLRAAGIRRAEILMANSRHTIARFKEANPEFARREIAPCHLGVPPETDLNPPPGAESGFALIVGRMSSEERYKGHDLLIELWPEIAAGAPGARLMIVGDGDDRARLERKAAESGAGGAIRFLGRVSDEALAGLYRDCGFFVMPSGNEGFGLVFLEAMRAGRACVAGRGAAEEFIRQGETGLIVEPGAREEICDAIVRLFNNADEREAMGRAGAGRLHAEFTTAHFRQRFRRALGLERGGESCAE